MGSNWVGKTLGKVKVESLLARGGVAEVYLGTHTTLERKVAVKILRNPSEEHSDALDRFWREARVVAKLRHPNIVQVYDFDIVDNDPYLVMEYIQGPSLSKYLHYLHQNNQRLELPQVVRLLYGVASALQYAHNNGIVHRDIKPGNILLTSPTEKIEAGKPLPEDFEPVLTDFGLVRFLDSSRQTTTGVTAGTPAYMSPEQAQGEATDGRTDIYSLGIVLYELLAGHLPFDGETTMGILLKHVNEPPAPIPGLAPHLQTILDRALAKKAKDRYQTALEFARAFSAAVDIHPETMQMESLPAFDPTSMQAGRYKTFEDRAAANKVMKPRWIRLALSGTIVLAIGAVLFMNGFPSFAPRTGADITSTATATHTSTFTSLPPVPPSFTNILHFENGSTAINQAKVIAQAMPLPPAGNQYEVWLVNSKERISLGILSLDATGMGELTFTDEQPIDLVATYDSVEVTIEPDPDPKPETPSGIVAYAFTLPADGLVHVRYLLSAYPSTPNQTALIQGLYKNIETIDELANEMQKANDSGDKTRAQRYAESIFNSIVGAQSPDYKDWNGDGEITDPSDGFGLLLNGSSFGYLQAAYNEADYTVNTPGVSQQMITNGELVKASIQNLLQWAPQLRSMAMTILTSPDNSDIGQPILGAVALADKLLNGIDANENGRVEAVIGEGGMLTAYENAYDMADMPLLPVGFINIGTGTPTFIGVTSVSTGGGGGGSSGGGGGSGGGSTPVPPTKKLPPGQQDKTKKPPPTQKNSNSSNK